MNERIKELAIECATSFDWGNLSVDPTEFCYSKQALEKFAELIVSECIEWTKGNGGLNAECDYDALKEYFGVEE